MDTAATADRAFPLSTVDHLPHDSDLEVPQASSTSSGVHMAVTSATSTSLPPSAEIRSSTFDSIDMKYDRKSWGALVVVSLNSALNAYMSMNTSAAEGAFVEALGVSSRAMGGLFSIFLFTVLVGMTPGMMLADQWECFGVGFSVFMNVASTWIRWASVVLESMPLCSLSVVVSAAGAWTILSLPGQLSQRRFPRRLWTLIASVAVQANYLGWLIGALIPPMVAEDAHTLERLLLVQAIVATPLLVLFFAFYRPHGQDGLGSSEDRTEDGSFSSVRNIHGDMSSGFRSLVEVSRSQPAFLFQVLAYGLLGGVSFAQPSAAIFILKAHGFDDKVSAYVNVAFLGAGVASGLVLGKSCSEPKSYGPALKSLFTLCAVCTVACAVLTYLHYVEGGNSLSLFLILCLSAGIGMSSLGFIGIGLAATSLYPVGAGHACWAVEIIIQGVGGALNLLAANGQGFITLAAFTVASLILIIGGYRLPRDAACERSNLNPGLSV